jgi:hypothetical protein
MISTQHSAVSKNLTAKDAKSAKARTTLPLMNPLSVALFAVDLFWLIAER